jgi:hypothetical protein
LGLLLLLLLLRSSKESRASVLPAAEKSAGIGILLLLLWLLRLSEEASWRGSSATKECARLALRPRIVSSSKE